MEGEEVGREEREEGKEREREERGRRYDMIVYT